MVGLGRVAGDGAILTADPRDVTSGTASAGVRDDTPAPSSLGGRQRAGVAIQAALAVSLIPAFSLFAPRVTWDPLLLGVLTVLGVVAVRTEASLPSGVRFEALSALSLIAVALMGPLPSLIVTLAPIGVNALCGRERLLRVGNLANVAAYGWYALLVHAVLQLSGGGQASGAWGWLLLAGILQLLVNWALGPAIYVTCWLGHPPRTAFEMLRDGLPTGVAMVLLGVATVLLTPTFGILALALFAAIAVLPQSALTYVARTRPVARLDRHGATRRYAHAIGVQLGLSRPERRHLVRVATAARVHPPTGDPLDYARATLRDGSHANHDAQLISEHWEGSGGPIGLRHEQIPLAARVLAAAETWSALTAHGTRELGHHDALTHLQARAGQSLDPQVVRAAYAVVGQEPVSAAEPAPEPRLHRLGVPAPLRRAVAAAATAG